MSANRGERIFCHECDQDFSRNGRGLRCPECESDFVEVIEESDDPRATQSPAAVLHNHNPWASDAPDPDEDDIDTYNTPSNRPGGYHSGSTQPPPGMIDPFQMFGMGGMRGTSPFGNNLFGQNRHPGMVRRDSDRSRARSVPGNRVTSGPGEPHVRIYRNVGPGHSFTIQTSSYNFPGNGGQHDMTGPHTMADLPGMMGQIFNSIGARPPGPAPGQRGASNADPFANFIQSLMGGNVGMHGDVNFGDFVSDGNIDRVLSQLMEQHTSGNAPGPASQTAIDALPKVPANKKHLGPEGAADCSICMTTIKEGDIVTELPCHHWFDPECVAEWLKSHDTCPICREGITPKEGESNTVRSPGQEPLHNENPAIVAQRQSGLRENPIFVPESPTIERRRRPYSGTPSVMRRHSSGLDRRNEGPNLPGAFPDHQQSSANQREGSHSGSSGGLGDRFRNWVSGGSSHSRR